MGLDYHYDNSPRPVQREVLVRQLKIAVILGKPLTIHTREADEDILCILKEHVPKEHKIHVHCFTDDPELAKELLEYFPNLYIGITGVITFSTNINTRQVIADMVRGTVANAARPTLRILLETDAPYMVPTNLPIDRMGLKPGVRIPFSHSAMIPWTADFVAQTATEASGNKWTWSTADVLRINEVNAANVYGI